MPLYFDYAATTPVDPRVAERMAGFLTRDGVFGNPASRAHRYGWQAEAAVEEARAQVAEVLGADPREIVWTSGATEADNLALKGCAAALGGRGRHLVTSRIEHKAVLDSCRHLEAQGFEVTYLSPDGEGRIAPQAVAEALRPDTLLVSVMHVNNELGSVNDIAAIGDLCRERGVLYHVDAAQSAGKIPLDVARTPVDLMSLSADRMLTFHGRADDMIILNSINIFPGEIERALEAHPLVAEAAVVGAPHDLKGTGIYCYVTLNAGETPSDELKKELIAWVRKEIGPIASPDWLQWAPGLPKTRSGKIMRRILRKIAENDFSNLGDTSTLADPGVVDDLVEQRQNR